MRRYTICTLRLVSLGGQVKEGEMGRTCSTHVRN
jgi:hypothetical protein